MNGKMSVVFVGYHKIYRFRRMQQKCIMEMKKKKEKKKKRNRVVKADGV